MTLLEISTFFLASAAGGAINSLAGGGTFLVFPILTMMGMSPFQSNIMCTIALWPGAISSAFGYKKELTVEKGRLFRYVLASIAGGVLGAELFLHTSELAFERMVPWLLLSATLIFTFGRKGISWMNQFSAELTPERLLAGVMLQFIIAIYGGYFGAGIGILMLAMLQLMGMHNIHQMNALRTILGSTINGVAVVVFCFSGGVDWNIAPVMVLGAIIGGYVGAKMALKVSPEAMRHVVSVMAFSMTAYYFYNK